TLVVAGRLRVPSDGVLSLSAGTIRIEGAVESLRPSGPVPGPQISLSAAQDLAVRGRIRFLGARASAPVPGALSLEAGGDLRFDGSLTATTSPTTISLRAPAGELQFNGRANLSRGGGEIAIEALTLRHR